MPLAVQDVTTQVGMLVGRLMNLVGIAAGVSDGTSPYLRQAIRDGLTRMGYALADPTGLAVADPDVAALDPRALRRLMEWAELHALEQVERDWWIAEANRPEGLTPRVENGITIDPLQGVKSRVVSRMALLREIVKTPYQSMNVPLAVGTIRIGSRLDRSIPPTAAEIIPPWLLAPDGLWLYGIPAAEFWGCDDRGYW